jgi:hypothetical protein
MVHCSRHLLAVTANTLAPVYLYIIHTHGTIVRLDYILARVLRQELYHTGNDRKE